MKDKVILALVVWAGAATIAAVVFVVGYFDFRSGYHQSQDQLEISQQKLAEEEYTIHWGRVALREVEADTARWALGEFDMSMDAYEQIAVDGEYFYQGILIVDVLPLLEYVNGAYLFGWLLVEEVQSRVERLNCYLDAQPGPDELSELIVELVLFSIVGLETEGEFTEEILIGPCEPTPTPRPEGETL